MSVDDLPLAIFGLLTGLVLGALGSGGSILAMPAFVYAAGLPVKSAVATSLAVVGATSLIGAGLAQRRCYTQGCPGQEVDPRLAGWFSFGGLFGAFVGARLAGALNDRFQMLLFAAVMALASVAMFRRRNCAENATNVKPRPMGYVAVIGGGVGLLTGVVGVGGGFLIVPALTLLAGVPVRRATSTSLWIIAANSATGLLGYLGTTPIAWNLAGAFLAASLVGVLIGQQIGRTAQPTKLRTAFAVFLVVVCVFTVTKTFLSKPSTPLSHSTRQP